MGFAYWREKQTALAQGRLKTKAAEKRAEKAAQNSQQLNLDWDSVGTPSKELYDSSADQSMSGSKNKRPYVKIGGPHKNDLGEPDEVLRGSSGDHEPAGKQQKVAVETPTPHLSQASVDYMG